MMFTLNVHIGALFFIYDHNYACLILVAILEQWCLKSETPENGPYGLMAIFLELFFCIDQLRKCSIYSAVKTPVKNLLLLLKSGALPRNAN